MAALDMETPGAELLPLSEREQQFILAQRAESARVALLYAQASQCRHDWRVDSFGAAHGAFYACSLCRAWATEQTLPKAAGVDTSLPRD